MSRGHRTFLVRGVFARNLVGGCLRTGTFTPDVCVCEGAISRRKRTEVHTAKGVSHPERFNYFRSVRKAARPPRPRARVTRSPSPGPENTGTDPSRLRSKNLPNHVCAPHERVAPGHPSHVARRKATRLYGGCGAGVAEGYTPEVSTRGTSSERLAT